MIGLSRGFASSAPLPGPRYVHKRSCPSVHNRHRHRRITRGAAHADRSRNRRLSQRRHHSAGDQKSLETGNNEQLVERRAFLVEQPPIFGGR
jgi:hypothetical protein